jgi:hypothetical protein
MRLAWVEAEGEFRGAPVTATLSKSHPAGTPSHTFDQLQIWVLTRESDELALNNDELIAKRQREYDAWYSPRQAEIMASYQVTDDMSLDELNATMAAQQSALDSLEDQGREREVHYALLNGPVNIENGVASLLASNLGWSGRGKIPDAFFDLDGVPIYSVAQCP